MSTSAYVDLMFARGHARLGEAGVARRLVAEAAERLHPSPDAGNRYPQVDPAHAWLVDAFTFRVEEAVTGRTHGGPWSEELSCRLRKMDEVRPSDHKSRRYVVDRLRAMSRILEPTDEVDPDAQCE